MVSKIVIILIFSLLLISCVRTRQLSEGANTVLIVNDFNENNFIILNKFCNYSLEKNENSKMLVFIFDKKIEKLKLKINDEKLKIEVDKKFVRIGKPFLPLNQEREFYVSQQDSIESGW